MMKNKKNYIADTIHGSIRISEIEKEIISSQIFNRLHNIYQNSTAYLTFPSNRTKRFEHSIGTMHLAGQIFQYGILNARKDTVDDFFNEYKKIIIDKMETVLSDDSQKYKVNVGDPNYEINKLKKFEEVKFLDGIEIVDEWIPHNIQENQKYMYMLLLQSIRLSGLLHDVGHPPYSHITEYAMKDIWHEIGNIDVDKRTKNENNYYNVINNYFADDGELHEKIGNSITQRLLSSLLKTWDNRIRHNDIKFYDSLFRVIVKETTSAILDEKGTFFGNIHKIISGALDADRLDYVTRDCVNSGLNVGRIEYDRLIPLIKLQKYDDLFYFCPSIKSIDELEDFFNRRWNLYKKVIFHHRVIKTDYLLSNCILELIKKNLQSEKEIDEKDTTILPYDISGLWKAVEKVTSDESFFNRLNQWDDSWLMVVLKKAYMELNDSDEDSILKDKLNELLASQKHYYSMVKNSDMFLDIEHETINTIKKGIPELKKLLARIKNKNEGSLPIDSFIEDLEFLIEFISEYDSKESFQKNGFCLRKISDLIFDNYFPIGEFRKIVKESIDESRKDNDKIRDVIVEFKQIKSGIQEELVLYDRNDERMYFKDVSNTAIILNMLKAFILPFYVYINIDDKDSIDYNDFRKNIGLKIGKNILKSLTDFLESSID